MFWFRKWGCLSDGVLDLTVESEDDGDPARDLVPCYHFRLAVHGDPRKVGELRLRIGSVEAHPSLLTSGHVGYNVDEPSQGHGYAARACRLAGPVALAHGLEVVIITCDPGNLGSVRTCERIGAVLLGTFDVPEDHPMYAKGHRRVARYEWRPGPPRAAGRGSDY